MLVRQIVIDNYPDRIVVSNKRRPVYFVNKKGLRGKTEIPKKYKVNRYFFDKAGYLVDRDTNKKVIANTKSVGTEKYWVVNFQDIWSGAIAAQSRASKANKLKDKLRPHIRLIEPIVGQYPLRMEIELYNTEFRIDASNKGVIYTKIIEDLLVAEGKIPDDSPEYINDTGRIKLFIREGTPKMIINIYTSDVTTS